MTMSFLTAWFWYLCQISVGCRYMQSCLGIFAGVVLLVYMCVCSNLTLFWLIQLHKMSAMVNPLHCPFLVRICFACNVFCGSIGTSACFFFSSSVGNVGVWIGTILNLLIAFSRTIVFLHCWIYQVISIESSSISFLLNVMVLHIKALHFEAGTAHKGLCAAGLITSIGTVIR